MVLKSAIRIGAASLISAGIVWLVSPSGLVSTLSVVVLAWIATMALLFVFREVQAIDFQVARSVLPRRLHGLVNLTERLYARWSSRSQVAVTT